MSVTLEQINPADLLLGENVRADARLDRDFVASIKERGVIEPVIGYRPDGEGGPVHVLRGLRRTLGAIAAGRDAIPVLVHDAGSPEEKDRLVDQLVENVHRAALHPAEYAAAVAQLALIGVSGRQIAKLTATPRAEVDAGLAVARTPAALAVLERVPELTLEDAAVLAEFDGDEEATALLVATAESGVEYLPHHAQRIRQDRADRAAYQAAAAPLREQGLTVLDVAPRWDDETTEPLTSLRHSSGAALHEDTHRQLCPGHVVWLVSRWSSDGDGFLVVSGCQGWREHGHRTATSTGASKTPAADLPAEEREAARLARRHVIESNKAWKAATTVRREWLIKFAGAAKAPAGAEAFLLAQITRGRIHTVEAWAMLGSEVEKASWRTPNPFAAQMGQGMTPRRALQIAVVLTLASWEADTHDGTWRQQDTAQAEAADVLAAMGSWGYGLSKIEQAIIAGTAHEPQPEAVEVAS